METSPARSFLSLTGKSFDTIGFAVESVSLLYFIQITSTMACNVIEQLPAMVNANGDFNLFANLQTTPRGVFQLAVVFGAGIGIRRLGLFMGSENLIRRMESLIYRSTSLNEDHED